jgi:hypothetical protein
MMLYSSGMAQTLTVREQSEGHLSLHTYGAVVVDTVFVIMGRDAVHNVLIHGP